MAPKKPDAFLSYTRFDDEDGEISAFRERLSRTVRQVSGEPFVIFQDVDDETGIALGEHWKDKLDEMLDKARFFVPILTPSFFRSKACRQELRTFLDLERKVGRQDLVLPIYWITCPVLEEGHVKAKDELAQAIDERQRWDWRELIFEDLKSAVCRRELHALSTQIERARRNVLRVVETSEPVRVGETEGERNPKSKAAAKLLDSIWEPPVSELETPCAPSFGTPGEVFRDFNEPWCPEMVVIPAGTFLMGSSEDEEGRRPYEGPQHEVTISKSFALGRYPITCEQYDHFCEMTEREKPPNTRWGRGRFPVVYVTYQDAEAYCTWLSSVTNAKYRLPTEAEWEYACRAGTTSAYAFGNTASEGMALFGERLTKNREVGSYPPNAWGLHDMHGSVWEFCADAPRSYQAFPATDPRGRGEYHVLRGGAWGEAASCLRSARRELLEPGASVSNTGFRCARVQRAIHAQSDLPQSKRSVWTIDSGRR